MHILQSFELCINIRLAPLICIDKLQFDFVPDIGCQKALFALDSLVNYYTSRGSSVFMAVIGAGKAFDKVNHHCLFYELLSVGVLVNVLNVLVNWHLKLAGCVLWCGVMSHVFI